MNELMPCPFCGNAKNLAMVNEKHDHSGGYFIACPECGASTIMRYAMGDDPKPLLIEAWNRRAALAAQPGAVGERMEAGLKVFARRFGHIYWGAGEKDCPDEIKAPNGELFKLRCKKCGEDNPKSKWCSVDAAAPTETKPAQDAVDAERYRWLRENNAYSIHDRLFADCPMHKFNDAMLDAAIDAAISAKKGQP